HAHDVTLRQDALEAPLAHDQHGADLALAEDLDRGREPGVRLAAQDLMAFGIENCTYRHCRLLNRFAPQRARLVRESSINSSAPTSFPHPSVQAAATGAMHMR